MLCGWTEEVRIKRQQSIGQNRVNKAHSDSDFFILKFDLIILDFAISKGMLNQSNGLILLTQDRITVLCVRRQHFNAGVTWVCTSKQATRRYRPERSTRVDKTYQSLFGHGVCVLEGNNQVYCIVFTNCLD